MRMGGRHTEHRRWVLEKGFSRFSLACRIPCKNSMTFYFEAYHYNSMAMGGTDLNLLGSLAVLDVYVNKVDQPCQHAFFSGS